MKLRLALLLVLTALCVSAQVPAGTAPVPVPLGPVMMVFRNLGRAWFAILQPVGTRWFWYLVTISFCWLCYSMLPLAKSGDWMAVGIAFAKRVVGISVSWYLVQNAGDLTVRLTDSFASLGSMAAGFGGSTLSPSDILSVGWILTGEISDSAKNTGLLGYLDGAGAVIVVSSFMCMISFALLACVYMMATIESIVLISLGSVFLSFLGCEWTEQFASKYISLVLSCGTKLFIVTAMIGAWLVISASILQVDIPGSRSPQLTVMGIAAVSLIGLVTCWSVPRYLASMLAGATAFTGFETLALVTGGVSMLVSSALMGSKAGSMASGLAGGGGGGAASGGGGGGRNIQSATSAMSASAPSGSNGSSSNGSGRAKQGVSS